MNEDNKRLEKNAKEIELNADDIAKLQLIIKDNAQINANEFFVNKYLKEQRRYWDIFYKNNKDKFFKNRTYFKKEFFDSVLNDDTTLNDYILKNPIIFDFGCGVGNSLFPLAKLFNNCCSAYIFDISKNAIELLLSRYNSYLYSKLDTGANYMKILFAGIWDLTNDVLPEKIENLAHIYDKLYIQNIFTLNNIEFRSTIGLCIFVLSAIPPKSMANVIKKIYSTLPVQSILLFRDYGRYDQKQIRFALRKTNQIGENLYVRHDGTLAYFFTVNELEELFTQAGFDILQIKQITKRLNNRKTKQSFIRCWIQAILIKNFSNIMENQYEVSHDPGKSNGSSIPKQKQRMIKLKFVDKIVDKLLLAFCPCTELNIPISNLLTDSDKSIIANKAIDFIILLYINQYGQKNFFLTEEKKDKQEALVYFINKYSNLYNNPNKNYIDAKYTDEDDNKISYNGNFVDNRDKLETITSLLNFIDQDTLKQICLSNIRNNMEYMINNSNVKELLLQIDEAIINLENANQELLIPSDTIESDHVGKDFLNTFIKDNNNSLIEISNRLKDLQYNLAINDEKNLLVFEKTLNDIIIDFEAIINTNNKAKVINENKTKIVDQDEDNVKNNYIDDNEVSELGSYDSSLVNYKLLTLTDVYTPIPKNISSDEICLSDHSITFDMNNVDINEVEIDKGSKLTDNNNIDEFITKLKDEANTNSDNSKNMSTTPQQEKDIFGYINSNVQNFDFKFGNLNNIDFIGDNVTNSKLSEEKTSIFGDLNLFNKKDNANANIESKFNMNLFGNTDESSQNLFNNFNSNILKHNASDNNISAIENVLKEVNEENNNNNNSDDDKEEEVLTGNWNLPTIELDKITVKTGEEEEVEIWAGRGKLFRFQSGAWIERGIGDCKLLKDSKERVRFLLRQDKTGKVVANHYVPQQTDEDVIKPKADNPIFSVWHSFDISYEEPEYIHVAMKVKNLDIAEEFRRQFIIGAKSNASVGKLK